jgi:hypothetical protein
MRGENMENEGTRNYFKVLADNPKPLESMRLGRVTAEVTVNRLMNEKILAIQDTLFFDKEGIVFRADRPGDPMLKYETRRS